MGCKEHNTKGLGWSKNREFWGKDIKIVDKEDHGLFVDYSFRRVRGLGYQWNKLWLNCLRNWVHLQRWVWIVSQDLHESEVQCWITELPNCQIAKTNYQSSNYQKQNAEEESSKAKTNRRKTKDSDADANKEIPNFRLQRRLWFWKRFILQRKYKLQWTLIAMTIT